MAENACPQCGATMQPITIGKLHDKFMHCDHCGYQFDVPDEVTIEELEEQQPYIDAQGQMVSGNKHKRITRRDVPTGTNIPRTDTPSEIDSEAIVDQLRMVLGDEYAEQIGEALDDIDLEELAASKTPGTAKVIQSLHVDQNVSRHTFSTSSAQPGPNKASPIGIAIAVMVIVLILGGILARVLIFSN